MPPHAKKPSQRAAIYVLCSAFLVVYMMMLNQRSITSVLNDAGEVRVLNEASSPPLQRIIVVSYVFGEKAANARYLQMFLESARHSGIDIAIVGFPKPPFPLPPNVKHVNVTWDQLVDRVSKRLFDGDDLPNLRDAGPYKVIDFKPLFAHLFPEQVRGYDWWGHVDNDLVLGNVPTFSDTRDIGKSRCHFSLESFRKRTQSTVELGSLYIISKHENHQ